MAGIFLHNRAGFSISSGTAIIQMFKFAFDVESDGNEDKELLDDLTALEIGGTESRWKIEENVPEAVRTFTLEELVSVSLHVHADCLNGGVRRLMTSGAQSLSPFCRYR